MSSQRIIRRHSPPPPRSWQYDEFELYLDRLSPDDKRAARAAMLGYVLGDVPLSVFEDAMALLRRSHPAN